MGRSLSINQGVTVILDRETITRSVCVVLALVFLAFLGFARTGPQIKVEGDTMTIEDAPDQEVVAFGKTVIVKNRVKTVSAVGGDIRVEGRITGDVATFGGSLYQTKDAYIGGDVFVIGGSYKPEIQPPLREAGKETVIFGMFEDEIRSMAQDPTQILAPSLSLSFFAQRILSVLFWFVVSFGFTTLAPGAISRAIARVQLSPLKIAGLGLASLVVTFIVGLMSMKVLPSYLSVSFSLMSLVLLLLAYLFGRVALQLSIGKMIQKSLFPHGNRSETLAILFGVLFWTLLLSVPYLWTFALLALFISGLGLVLTARSSSMWANS